MIFQQGNPINPPFLVEIDGGVPIKSSNVCGFPMAATFDSRAALRRSSPVAPLGTWAPPQRHGLRQLGDHRRGRRDHPPFLGHGRDMASSMGKIDWKSERNWNWKVLPEIVEMM